MWGMEQMPAAHRPKNKNMSGGGAFACLLAGI
jgi:hypothetical protein